MQSDIEGSFSHYNHIAVDRHKGEIEYKFISYFRLYIEINRLFRTPLFAFNGMDYKIHEVFCFLYIFLIILH